MEKQQFIAPAPWTLSGNGHILVYRFSKEFINKNGHLQDYQKGNFKGIVGTIMLVDYQVSPVGPYQELLIVPGIFNINDKNRFSISKIYVSSQDSVYNGIENWGIPKEFADFKKTVNGQSENIEVSIQGNVFFKAEIVKKSFKFPISTAIFPLKLVQKLRNKLILTNSTAKGKAMFSRLQNIEVNQEFFPDVSDLKPILTLSVENFKMTFPVPTILEYK
jgi:Acetoacetate decarboxylase (ADC)